MFSLSSILNGLGLLPAESRTVKTMPAELKALVPPPVDNTITVKASTPDVEGDTMPLIISKAKRTAWQVKKLAAKLKGATLAETLRNNSQFVLDYIKYKKDDPAHEEVRSPRRLVYDGHGDCDCFAVFLAALLINQGIQFYFRITSYQNGGSGSLLGATPDWQHIYIVVPKDQRNKNKSLHTRSDYYVLDPVTNQHDHEVSFLDKKDFTMALKSLDGYSASPLYQSLSGLSCCCDNKNDSPNSGSGSQVVINNTNEQKTVYVMSAKALEQSGFTPSGEYLAKTGLPYFEKQSPDGVPYYEVHAPAGIKQIPSYIPTNAKDQEKITEQLFTPAPVNNTAQASTDMIAPTTKVVGVALAILGATWAFKKIRENQTSAKGLGTLDKKRLPVVQL